MNHRLTSLFAGRYLFSKKSHSVINIISVISAVAIGVPVAAMVILMSVFNGFESLIKGLYDDFDADFLVTPAKGKYFTIDPLTLERIASIKGVSAVSKVLEDNAMVEHNNREVIATIRGVDSMFDKVIPIEKLIVNGNYKLHYGDHPQAIVGRGIAYALAVNSYSGQMLRVITPKQTGSFSSLLPLGSFAVDSLMSGGVFTLDAQNDSKYIFVPLEFAQRFFNREGITALFISAQGDVGEQIKGVLGEGFEVKSRYEQKSTIYKMMRYEKWALALVSLLVMVIASFALVGSLSMLIIEKRRDISVLGAIGWRTDAIRRIFITEGLFISLIGGFAGLFLGLAVSLTQQYFGVIKIPARSMLIDSYPVVVEATDVAIIIGSFMAINYIIAIFTVSKMIKR